ncbi:MAG: hypothetical protein H8E78_05840, partial [Proteobacteria bacterium]|nr:hypothetical protein [Pseudomonadota bacterium]
TRTATEDILVDVFQADIRLFTQHANHMTNVTATHAATRLEQSIEILENAARERNFRRLAVDAKFIASRVNRYCE